MKKIAIALGLFLATGSFILAQSQTFPDVQESDWFYEYVESIKNWGIINGHADGTYKPEQNINRAQFAKMLYLYDERINTKIDEKIPEISPNTNTPTVMYLESYDDGDPSDCPTNWDEADYKRTWRPDHGEYVMTRTCYTAKECSVMNLKAYDEDPNMCPKNWAEANFKQTLRESGGKRQYTRTCFICE